MADLGQAIFREVLPIIGAAVGVILLGILQRLFKRIGLELTEKQQQAVRATTENIIVSIEEEARRRMMMDADLMTSQEKRDQAVIRLLEKHPGLTEGEALEMLDALLPKVRQLIPGTSRLPAPAASATAVRRH